MDTHPIPDPSPDISVALCTYNRADLLAQTLHSLVGQKVHGIRFEIVVVDDGSTDRTAAVVDAARRTAPVPVRYVAQQNRGVGRARNRAVNEARGTWIAFIDDDELACERWLDALFGATSKTGADCVGGPSLIRLTGPCEIEPVGTIGMLLGENPAMKAGSASRLSFFDRLRFRATRIAVPGGGNALVRKQLIEVLGGFEATNYGEDLDFFRRAQRAGARFATAPEARIYHLTPPDRLAPGRLQALAKRSGASQAALDRSHAGSGRQTLLAVLRAIHACGITLPALLVHAVRSERSYVASRMCSLHFAMAYIRSCFWRSAAGSPAAAVKRAGSDAA